MQKKRNKRKKTIIVLFIFVLLMIFFFFFFLIIKKLSPFYEIEDRTKKVQNYKGRSGESAVGWLKVQGTNIDFPIVYYDDTDVTDPTYDLGWTDLDYNNFPKRLTIFSHNVLNVSSNPLIANKDHRRFEQLLSFIYPNFLKSNKYIEYSTKKHNYLYKIYAVSFQTEQEFELLQDKKIENKEYIKKTKENSYFKFNTDVNKNDKLLTLVTCTRFFGATSDYSFVVDARRVRKEEKIKNYGIFEKMSYNRIKKIMEGEDEDEKI